MRHQTWRNRPGGLDLGPWQTACLTVALTVGCATESHFVWVEQIPVANQNIEAIEPRDSIQISVRNQPTLSGEFLVGDHGNYSQPTLGTIPSPGRPPTSSRGTSKSD